MTAIGIMILFTQIQPLLGYKPSEDQALIEKFVPQAEEAMLQKFLQKEAGEDIVVLTDFENTITRAKTEGPEAIKLEAVNLAKDYSSG